MAPLTAAVSAAQAIKPKLRGWIHAAMLPATIAAGTVLIVAAHGSKAKAACAVFVATALMLFGLSGVYHLGRWSQRAAGVLRRLDHSNIALIIAGTYTPLAALALPSPTSQILLASIWGGAVGAIGVRVIWLNAPRWSYVPIYIALGWVAVWFLPQFWRLAGPAVVTLILAGGVAYTAGAVIYGVRRPNPSPRWFGFHEVFHACTVAGFTCHLIAVWLISTR
jgi:hemolysin III